MSAIIEPKISELGEEILQDVDTTQIELVTDMTSVHSPIKDRGVTKDFVYAKLDEQDKKGITDSIGNGELAYWLYDYYIQTFRRNKWDDKTKSWSKESMTKEEVDRIKELRDRTRDSFMVRPVMTAVLNRNTAHNYMLRHITKVDVNDAEAQEDTIKMSKLSKLKESLMKED